MKKKHFLLILSQILLCNFLIAQTWNGSTSTDWNTPGNWTPANVPTATSNVTIPGSLTRYPVLATDVTITSINMAGGSQLDFKGRTLDIVSGSNYNYFYGTLNNSDGATDIVININTGINGYGVFARGNIVNDNITFNLTSTNAFNDADNGGSAGTYNGDVTFNVKDALALNLSNGSASQYNGNLTINRTIKGGNTTMFNAGGNVTGNFKFVNNLDGILYLGSTSKQTSINGKVDITLKQATAAPFSLFNIKNQTSGGLINVQNTLGFDVQKDTLKVASLSITGYRGNAYGTLYNNDITGNLILTSDETHIGGYSTYLRSNKITGNATFTNKGQNSFLEADNGNSGNQFTGDVNFTAASKASLSLSQGGKSKYEGNLSITRTGAGNTDAFNAGAMVGGNFSFTNNTAGNVSFGNAANVTNIGGKVDIAINDTLPGIFELLRIINNTSGGVINIQNSLGFNVQKDTLKVGSLSITGYQGYSFGQFYNNDITGNLVLSSDVKHLGGYHTYFRSNKITGNATFTNKGQNSFLEADNGNSGNHFTGNVIFNAISRADLVLSNGDMSKFDGNLSITRTGAGNTSAFNAGAMIGGNFSYINNTAGNASFGNAANVTSIGGKVDIVINDTLPGIFELLRLINNTSGGVINVQNSLGFNVQKDTLKVASLNITGYQGYNYGQFYNNNITGNLVLSSGEKHLGGYHTYLRSNNIIGNATLTNQGSNIFFDADNGNSGNHYSGDVIYNKISTAAFTVGTGDTTSIGGGLSLNSNLIVLDKIQFTDNNDGIVQQTGSVPIIIPTMIMKKGGTAKITLMDTLKVTGSLNLISGIIKTGVNSNLVLPDNITYMGGSDSSYVDGPMLKIGNDAFTFPVGQKNFYAPISITAPAVITDQFRGQYVATRPHDAGYDSTKKDATLDHISMVEYWLLDRTAGTSDASVTLSWTDNRSGGVTDIASLRVARWDGSTWKNLGKGTTTGNNAKGTIQTAAAVTSFSPFTLASTTTLNPLPINISRFDAQKNKQSVSLKWTTENEINFSHFEVERADGNNNFSALGKVSAHNSISMQYYSFEDNQPLKGVNLYRLKLVGQDGKSVYSNVKSILFNANGSITIYPNPAVDYIQIDGLAEGVAIEINDAGGRLVKRMISNASNRYSVNDLRKGMYFIKILDKENKTVSKLIIQ